ncbi:MAG: trypsin-like peptidase domain-containing protein [Vicinamibacterales bacterium]
MPKLSPRQQLDLLDLLITLPSTRTAEQREALLFSLPAQIADMDLPGDRQAAVAKMIEALEYWGQLTDGRWATEVMLLNAMRAAKGTQFEPQLEGFRQVFALPASHVELPDLEEQVAGDVSYLMPVGFLGAGDRASRAVARLCVPQFMDGRMVMRGSRPSLGLGTGWLIAPGLIATNRHVVAARFEREPAATAADLEQQATHTEAWFDYLHPDAPYITVNAMRLEALNADLDYAILRLAPTAQDGVSSRQWDSLRLAPLDYALHRGAALNIIQHPAGEVMQIAIRRNDFVGPLEGDPNRFTYLTDTLPGSSGSPVFNDEWEVVGLHRGSRKLPEQVYLKGEAIKYNNVGVLMRAILADLPPELRAEIEAAQPGR